MTPSTYPPHLACGLHPKPWPEFFSFYDLSVHYWREHPLVMDPTRCVCGHREASHNNAPTKRYCQTADPEPCPCRQYQRRREAA